MTAGASAVLVVIGVGAAGIAMLTEDKRRTVTAGGQHEPPPAAQDGVGPAAPRPRVPGLTQQGAEALQRKRAAAVGGPVAAANPANAANPAGLHRLGDQADPVDRRGVGDEADRSGTRPPRTPTAAAPNQITSVIEIETRVLPYRTRLVRDPALPRGGQRVQIEGVPGEERLRWQVTYTNGRRTDRRLLDTVITRQPQQRVVAFGVRGRGNGFRGPGGWQRGDRADRGWKDRGRGRGGCRPGRGPEKNPNGLRLNAGLVC